MGAKEADRSRFNQPFVAPPNLPGFPNATLDKPKATRGHKPRTRWREKDGTFYEFDRRHGTIEKYDKRGNHQGEFTVDGRQTKPPNPNYKAIP